MTPSSTDSLHRAASAAAERSVRGAAGLVVVVVGLIIEGLLPIGSIDGEDQNLH